MGPALLMLGFACQNQYIVDDTLDPIGSDTPADDTGGGDTEEEDFSMYDGATLVVTSPLSGSFLPYQESSDFTAVITSADGEVMDFDDITWTSDIDDAWTPTGAAFQNDSLDVGTHALTATAILPNGDRLAYSVGGILVQSAYTGIYTGTLQVDASGDYNGTTYEAGCSGAITLIVDQYGDTATGDAGCLISLLGYDLDMAYLFDLENHEGDLAGAASLDLTWYQFDIDATGSLSEDGEAAVTFTQDVYGFVQLDGSVEATRVSRDVSEYTD